MGEPLPMIGSTPQQLLPASNGATARAQGNSPTRDAALPRESEVNDASRKRKRPVGQSMKQKVKQVAVQPGKNGAPSSFDADHVELAKVVMQQLKLEKYRHSESLAQAVNFICRKMSKRKPKVGCSLSVDLLQLDGRSLRVVLELLKTSYEPTGITTTAKKTKSVKKKTKKREIVDEKVDRVEKPPNRTQSKANTAKRSTKRRGTPSATRGAAVPKPPASFGAPGQLNLKVANPAKSEPNKGCAKRKPLSPSPSPHAKDVFCICHKKYQGGAMVECASPLKRRRCNSWVHVDCFNLKLDEIEKMKQYICPMCKHTMRGYEMDYRLNKNEAKPKICEFCSLPQDRVPKFLKERVGPFIYEENSKKFWIHRYCGFSSKSIGVNQQQQWFNVTKTARKSKTWFCSSPNCVAGAKWGATIRCKTPSCGQRTHLVCCEETMRKLQRLPRLKSSDPDVRP